MLARVACAAALFFSTGAFAEDHPSVEAFGELPLISHPHLSPDGKRFVAIQSLNGKPTVAIYTVGAPPGTLPNVVPTEDGIIEDVAWVKNNRLIITLKKSQKQFLDNRMRTWVRAVSVAEDGSGGVVLLRDNVTFDSNTFAGVIADPDIDDPTYIYVPLFVGRIQPQRMPYEDIDRYNLGTAEYDIEKVDVTTGEGHQYMRGGPYTILWLMDGHGNVLARLDQSMKPLREDIYVSDKDDWRLAGDYDADADGGAHVMGLTEDEKAIVRVVDNAQGYRALVRMPLEAGKPEEPLFSAPDADVLGVVQDEWSHAVVGANYADDKMEYVYFDPERQALEERLEKMFPGLTVHPVSADVAHDAWIVETEGPRDPPTYYYLAADGEPVEIANSYPSLKPADLGEVKPYAYKARDGLDISAYLTLPPGKDGKNLPVVVMPHGGPDERDMEHFDWWVQFLANRGYAVLQPNFRGSIGYGRKFTDAGLAAMGPENAGRHFRRREKTDRRWHRRSQAHLHRWRELWRLCRTCGRNLHARSLCLCREFRGRFRFARTIAQRKSRQWQGFQNAIVLVFAHRLHLRQSRQARRHLTRATCRSGEMPHTADARRRRHHRAHRPERVGERRTHRRAQGRDLRALSRRGSLPLHRHHADCDAERAGEIFSEEYRDVTYCVS